MDCSHKGEHAHKYVNDEGFVSFQQSEYEIEEGFKWTEEIVKYTEEIKFLDEHNLLRIEDNKKLLEEIMSQNISYTEFEYTTIEEDGIYNNYTIDSNYASLTGRIREVNYKYYAYKTVILENGNIKIERSELVDNILDISNEFPYFNLNDYIKLRYSAPYKVFYKKLQ